MDAYQLARFIKEAKKTTPVTIYLQGDLESIDFTSFQTFGEGSFRIIFGDYDELVPFLTKHQSLIKDFCIVHDRRRSALPLLDLKEIDARIEPGAIIRDQVSIGKDVVVMMGAVINIGAEIGAKTMIDMNAVVGARAQIGGSCHIGAGAVIAGVLEPPSKQPVIIEDDVLVGANAVVLEGIRVGQGAIVAAGAVVTKDVAPNQVVAGVPARVINDRSQLDASTVELLDDLRG